MEPTKELIQEAWNNSVENGYESENRQLTPEQLASDMYDRVHFGQIDISFEDFTKLIEEFVSKDYTF